MQTQETKPAPRVAGFSLAARLGWVSFFNDASSEAIARTLPLFLVSGLGATPAFVGVVEGLAEALALFLKAFSGWLSDRMRTRKPLVVAGYTLSFLSRACLLFVAVPAWLAAARLLDRTGKGLRTAPRDALVADAAASGTAGGAFGLTRFLDTLGAVVGLAIAYGVTAGLATVDSAGATGSVAAVGTSGISAFVVSRETFHTLVRLALPPGLIAVVLVAWFVPALPRAAGVRAKKAFSLRVPRGMRGYIAVVALFALANSSDAFLALRARELGLTFPQTLLAFLALNVLAAGLAWPLGRLSDRFGRVRFLAAGWILYALAYAGMALGQGVWAFAASLFLYGSFYGFTEGVEKALAADLLAPEERGTGYGALQLVLGLGALPASLLTGVLMTIYGAQVALLVSAGLAALAVCALLLWSAARRAALRAEVGA